MGLPSGTLWLDRLVGAPTPSEPALFYQWGDIVGHSIAEGYDFSLANYEAKGLSGLTSNLDNAHDAARSYYGSIAKMPSANQFQELIDNCVVSLDENNLIVLTSNINGSSITMGSYGYFVGLEQRFGSFRVWSAAYSTTERGALAFICSDLSMSFTAHSRYHGYCIMAVHS